MRAELICTGYRNADKEIFTYLWKNIIKILKRKKNKKIGWPGGDDTKAQSIIETTY